MISVRDSRQMKHHDNVQNESRMERRAMAKILRRIMAESINHK